LEECLSAPKRFDGATLKLGNNTKAGTVRKNSFELLSGVNRITVMGSVEGLKTDDYVDIVTIFHKQGYLELKEIYVRKLRRLKIFLSIFPVLLLPCLILRQYRFDFSRNILVEK
jgi:hypothetical protein